MKTTHTPAPWKLLIEGSEDDCIIRTIIIEGRPRNLSEIALVTTGSFPDEIEEANAQLIAAAPDLLEALQVAIDSLDTGSPYYDEVRNTCQQAINKATQP
jgi:hypothetical protein